METASFFCCRKCGASEAWKIGDIRMQSSLPGRSKKDIVDSPTLPERRKCQDGENRFLLWRSYKTSRNFPGQGHAQKTKNTGFKREIFQNIYVGALCKTNIFADMKLKDEINKRRTFGIVSHPDAGKTTLTEKLLLFG